MEFVFSTLSFLSAPNWCAKYTMKSGSDTQIFACCQLDDPATVWRFTNFAQNLSWFMMFPWCAVDHV